MDFETYLKKKDFEQLTKRLIAQFSSLLAQKEKNGYYVLYSAGPGADGNGAPGMSSAVALKLLVEAVGPAKIRPVIFEMDGYTNPEWVEKAVRYADTLDLDCMRINATELGKAYCHLLKSQGVEKYPESVFTRLRTILIHDMAMKDDFLTASCYTKISSAFYKVSNLSDTAQTAPLGEFDRISTIQVGRCLGIEDNILNAPPSNGAVNELEANRMMNRFFTDFERWEMRLSKQLDEIMYCLDRGMPIPVYEDKRLNDAALKAQEDYQALKGHLDLVNGITE